LFTTIAVLFDYLYQIFFFTSIVYIGGLKEEQNSKIEESQTPNEPDKDKPPIPTSTLAKLVTKLQDMSFDLLLDFWVKLAMSKAIRITVGILLMAYWVVSIYGLREMQVGLKSENMFLEDSPLMDFLGILKNVVFVESGQARNF
jgi:hypothetical protein